MFRIGLDFQFLSIIIIQQPPSYILLVLTSGDSTIAVNGSQLLLDDLELIYSPSYLNEIDSPIKCWFSNNILHTGINPSLNSYSLNIYDISGKLVLNEQVSSYQSKEFYLDFIKGFYLVNLSSETQNQTLKIIVQ